MRRHSIAAVIALALPACSSSSSTATSSSATSRASAAASGTAHANASSAASAAPAGPKAPPPPPKLAVGVEIVGLTKDLYDRVKIDGFEDGRPVSQGTSFDPKMIAYPSVAADTVAKDEVLMCSAPREVQGVDGWVLCYATGTSGEKITVKVENIVTDTFEDATLDGEHIARPEKGLKGELEERLKKKRKK